MELKLSVIIPAYNAQNHIYATLNSLTSELDKATKTYSGFFYEIILVNDGSKDNTLVEAAKLGHSSVKIIDKPSILPPGVSSTRNYGLDYALGDYVWYFDADDLLFNNSGIPLIGYLVKYAPDILTFGSVTMDNHTKNHIESYNNSSSSTISYKGSYLDYLKGHPCPSTCWISIVRRRILCDNSIYCNPKLTQNEDLMWNLDIACAVPDASFMVTNLNVVKYVMLATSAINTINHAKNRRHLDSFLYCYELLESEKFQKKDYLKPSIDKYLPKLPRRIVTRFLSSKLSGEELKSMIGKINSIVDSVPNRSMTLKAYRIASKNLILIRILSWSYRNVFLPYIKPTMRRN